VVIWKRKWDEASVYCGTPHFRKVKLMEMIFKNLIRTSVEINRLSKINTRVSRLTTLSGMTGVCSENHTKHLNTVSGQNEKFVNVKAGDKCRVL
jgi:hypothetical protein